MKSMNKIKTYFINNKNKSKMTLDILIILIYFTFSLLLPTLSYTQKYHLIPFAVAGVMVVLMLLWIIFYGKIYLDYPTIAMILFLFFNVFSSLVNGFRDFNRTAVVLPILFIFIYQYVKNTKTIKLFAHITFIGYLFFAVVFSIFYSRELIEFVLGNTGSQARLGEAFGNVNGIGNFFAIGFAFSLYYAIIKKKYYNLVFSLLFLFLSTTTVSKTAILLVVVSLIIVLIVKFGLKKWYITVSIITGFIILGAIVLNIPAFSFLQYRILKMFEVFLGTSGSKADGSTVVRLNMVYEGVYGFFQKPIFGWGHEGFRSEISSYGKYSHNNYIDLLSNYGLAGFLTFESIIFVPLFKYFSRKKIIENANNPEAKNLISLMMIFSVFIFFVQFTGVQSVSKVDYVLLALISVISTECFQKKNKTAVYIPLTTRHLFKKVEFLKIEEPETNELELQIVSIKNLFNVLKEKVFFNKTYFLATTSSIKNPNNKILLFREKSNKMESRKKDIYESKTANKQINKRDKFLNSAFIVFLSVQGTLAFSFSFYNSKPHLLNSAIEIANKQQIKNKDPYVSFSDIGAPDTYSRSLLRQGAEKEEFKTLNPYIKLDTREFSYGEKSFNFAGITVQDLNSNGTVLKGIDLPVVFQNHSLEPLNGADYALMITSTTAQSLLSEEATNISSLIGKTFSDSDAYIYSINNIIYNENVSNSQNDDIDIYNNKAVALSTHLSELNGDYIVYITAPMETLSAFKYSFAYYPEGYELLDYINNNYENYGANKNNESLLEFFVLSENEGYAISENYSIINAVYATYSDDSTQIYQILLTIISVVLYALNFAIIFDISRKQKKNNFLFIALIISLLLSFIPLVFVHAFSNSLQIHVLANKLTFVYIIVCFSSLLLFLLIKKAIQIIKIRKRRPQ